MHLLCGPSMVRSTSDTVLNTFAELVKDMKETQIRREIGAALRTQFPNFLFFFVSSFFLSSVFIFLKSVGPFQFHVL